MEELALPLIRCGQVIGYARVDAIDYYEHSRWVWRLSSNGYAYRSVSRNGKKIALLLHRQLLSLGPDDFGVVDHINHDKLDNRRQNLRVVTHAENMQNRLPHRGSTSRYRGVYWHARKRKWRAVVRMNSKAHHLGQFDSEEEAAEVARRWRAEYMPSSEDYRERVSAEGW